MNCQLNKPRQKEECHYGNSGEDGMTEEGISERDSLCYFAFVSSHTLLESDQVGKGEN